MLAPGAVAPVAIATRGETVESVHFGGAAVVAPPDELVGAVGDPAAVTFLRSAAKPFQALPLLLAGGEQAYGLDDGDIALICASHGGTPAHVERAAGLLARAGCEVSDLACGAHPPMDAAAAAALASSGNTPSPLHNNCSGKHAGMLLACRLRGWTIAGYLDPEHPLQREIRTRLAALAGVAPDSIGIAVDGCSAPTFALPLRAAARAYAALAAPELAGVGGTVGEALARIGRAMTAAPEMVAGPGRFTTCLMTATRGRIVAKEGAEGFYGCAVLGPVAIGVALKIADGGERARDGVVLEVLRQAGALAGAEVEELKAFHVVERRNHRDLPVGEIRPEVVVRSPQLDTAE